MGPWPGGEKAQASGQMMEEWLAVPLDWPGLCHSLGAWGPENAHKNVRKNSCSGMLQHLLTLPV